jgi:hypothetical protein
MALTSAAEDGGERDTVLILDHNDLTTMLGNTLVCTIRACTPQELPRSVLASEDSPRSWKSLRPSSEYL